MRQFAAFVHKEFLHIIRDRWTTIILLAMPILMLVLFGFAISTEVKGTGLVVCDPSRDEYSRGIVEALRASGYFRIEAVLDNPDEAEGAFRSGAAGLALVFGERFTAGIARNGDARLLLIADGSDPNTATTLVAYARSVISSYLASKAMPGAAARGPRIEVVTRLLYNPQMKAAYNFVPGVMGAVLMLVCAMMTSISIAREKEKGSLELLLASPVRPLLIIVAKAVPYLALSAIDLGIILITSVYVLGVPIAGSLAWLVIVSLVYILVALALGLLVSSVAKTQLIALLVSGMVLMMPVILLSGMMFPVESMPLFLRAISAILPARWYIQAVKKLMIMGLGIGSALKELAILSGMAVALLAAGLRAFKLRLE